MPAWWEDPRYAPISASVQQAVPPTGLAALRPPWNRPSQPEPLQPSFSPEPSPPAVPQSLADVPRDEAPTPWGQYSLADLKKGAALLPPAPAAPVEPVPQPGVLSDIGNLLKSGYANTAQGVGWLAGKIPGLNQVVDSESTQDYWRDAAAQAHQSLSPEQQEAGKKQFFNDDYSLGEAWSDPRAYLGTVVQSIPGTVIGMGLGGPLTGGLQRAGLAMLPKLGAVGAERLAMGAGAVGYGSGEGLVSGMSNAAQIRDRVLAMPHEALDKTSAEYRELRKTRSPDEARAQLADIVANQVGLESGLTVGLTGAPAGMLLGKLFHGSGQLANTRLGSVGVAAGGEMAQETVQSGAEQYLQNKAIQQHVDPSQSRWEGVLNQMAAGGLAGGVMGGAMGMAGHGATTPTTRAEAARIAEQQANEANRQAKREELAQFADQVDRDLAPARAAQAAQADEADKTQQRLESLGQWQREGIQRTLRNLQESALRRQETERLEQARRAGEQRRTPVVQSLADLMPPLIGQQSTESRDQPFAESQASRERLVMPTLEGELLPPETGKGLGRLGIRQEAAPLSPDMSRLGAPSRALSQEQSSEQANNSVQSPRLEAPARTAPPALPAPDISTDIPATSAAATPLLQPADSTDIAKDKARVSAPDSSRTQQPNETSAPSQAVQPSPPAVIPQYSVRPTGFPVGGWYVTNQEGTIERFGAPDGALPKRFNTEEAAIKAAEKLSAKAIRAAQKTGKRSAKQTTLPPVHSHPQHVSDGVTEPATPPVVDRALMDGKTKQAEVAKAVRTVLDEIDGHIANAGNAQKAGEKITIEVPGDGKFKILNNKAALQAFRKKVENSSAFKASGPELNTTIRARSPSEAVKTPKALEESVLANLEAEARFNDPADKATAWELVKLGGTRHVLGENGALFTHAEPVPQRPSWVVARQFGAKGKRSEGRVERWKIIDPDTGISLLSDTSKARALARVKADAVTTVANTAREKASARTIPYSVEEEISEKQKVRTELAARLGVEPTGEAIQKALAQQMDQAFGLNDQEQELKPQKQEQPQELKPQKQRKAGTGQTAARSRGSWVIVNQKTGKAVFETFDQKIADKVARDYSETHKAVPIQEYLGELNKKIKAEQVSSDLGATSDRVPPIAKSERLSTPQSKQGSALSIPKARAQLTKALGERYVKVLEQTGRLHFNETDPTRMGAAGFVDAQGVIHLIPANMDQDALSVALHEAIHIAKDERFLEEGRTKVQLAHAVLQVVGLKNFIGNPGFSNLVQEAYRLAAAGNPIAQQALGKAKAEAEGNPTTDIPQEMVAYLVQYADEKLPLVRRVLAAIRAVLYRMGVRVQLTPADVRALALSALKAQAKAASQRQNVGVRSDPVYSMGEFAPTAEARAEVEQQMRAVKEMRDAEGRLLAPNGELSRLNDHQWKAVRTPFFKRWFGDWEHDAANASKIVDENGEPKAVYHGTLTQGKAIDAFDLKKIGTQTDSGWLGSGIYFGSPRTANSYAGYNESDSRNFPSSGAVYPAFLNLRNPATLLDSGKNNRGDWPSVMVRDLIGLPEEASSDQVRDGLQRAGYDGVFYQRAGGYQEYAAFDSVQVKSAVGNAGTFSPRSPRIGYSQPGADVGEASWEEFQAVRAQFKARLANAPAFQRWFGQGIEWITAKDGKPLTLYHGSPNTFHQFDAARAGQNSQHPTAGLGFFMTADRAVATRYGEQVLELHAKLEKPYFLTDADLMGVDSVGAATRLRRTLQAKGYDGAVLAGPGMAPYVIAFESNQVKLTSNQNPTESADFRFSRPTVGYSSDELPANKNDVHAYRLAALAVVQNRYAGKPAVKVTIDSTGESVMVGFAGVKHALRAVRPSWQTSLAALHVEDLLKNAEKITVEADRYGRKDPIAIHHYRVRATFDGVDHHVALVVREHSDGSRYYDHAVIDEKAPAGLPESQRPQSSDLLGLNSGAKESITPKQDDKNRYSRPGRPAPSQSGQNAPPAETKIRAFQRKAQDKFNRFEVVQDWLKDSGIRLTEAANVYDAEALLPKKTAAAIEKARETILRPLVKRAAKGKWALAGGQLIDAIAAGTALPATFKPSISEYLHAAHAKEANAAVAKINPRFPGSGSGLSDAQADAIVSRYQQRADFAAFKALADEVQTITKKTRDIGLQSGRLDPAMVKAWDAAYQYYVPLKGGPEDTAAQQSGTGQGISVGGKQKRRLGHTLRDESIIENIWLDHERAIFLAEKQVVAGALKEMLTQANNAAVGTVGKPEKRAVLKQGMYYQVWVNGAALGAYTSYKEAKAAIAQDSQLSGRPVAQYGIRHQFATPSVIYSTPPMLADNEVALYENGQLVRLQLNDELLARAARNLGVDAANGLLRAAQGFNRYLSSMYTGYNPEFLLTNMARDFTSGFVNLTGHYGIKSAAKAIRYYPSAVKGLLRYIRTGSDPLVDRYRAAGGSTGAAYLSDLERIGTDIKATFQDMQGARATWESGDKLGATRVATFDMLKVLGRHIENLNKVGENALRVATFKMMLENGASEAVAARAAGDVTVNFNRKGELTTQLGGLYLFFNPSVQGTKAMWDALSKGEHRGQAIALVTALAGLALFLSEWGRSGDEEDEKRWKEMSGYEKDRNMIIPLSGDKDVKIPVPYGYGIFWSLGNALSDLAHGEDQTKVGIRLASSLFEQFSPVGNPFAGDEADSKNVVSMAPTALKPLLSVAMNRSELGRPVMPEVQPWNPNKPDSQRMWRQTRGSIWDEMTSGLNRWTGGDAYRAGAVDVSPETMRLLWRTLVGGVGQAATDTASLLSVVAQGAASEVSLREVPIVRRFARSDRIQDARSLFHEQADQIRGAMAMFQAARKDGNQEAMRSIAQDNRALLALGKVLQGTQKLIRARRQIADAIERSDLPLADKRRQLRAMEQQEAVIYQRFYTIFENTKERQAN